MTLRDRALMRAPMAFLLAGTAVFAAACADVTVRKVPTPAQYGDAWTVRHQEKADAMEGLRFYLPRPFINVFESFPISTEVYFVNGVVSADGEFVHLGDIRAGHPLVDLFAGPLASDRSVEGATVSKEYIRRPTLAQMQDAIDLQSTNGETPPDAQEKIDEAIANAAGEAVGSATERAERAAARSENAAERSEESSDDARRDADRAAEPVTGQNRRAVTNDNSAFAYQPLRGNFDIAYLPDFDEQYVVSSRSGLGNAAFAVNLGQGWSLQGFNSSTDNSELTKRIFGFMDTAIKTAETGLAALTAGPAGMITAGGIELQSVAVEEDAPGAELAKGEEVLLKIVVVHYAAKGLYPVIKPRELLQQPPSAVYVDTDKDGRTVVKGIKTITDAAVRRAVERDYPNNGRYTVPVYPYQYISFNTFRYVAIELVTKDGAPFGTLYDKTGTVGDPGDRRAVDPPTQRVSPGAGPPPPPKRTLDDVRRDFEDKIKDAQRDGQSLAALDGEFTGLLTKKETVLLIYYLHPTEDASGATIGAGFSFPATMRNAAKLALLEIATQIRASESNANLVEDVSLVLMLPPSDDMLQTFQGKLHEHAERTATPTTATVQAAAGAQSYEYELDPPPSTGEDTKIQAAWLKVLMEDLGEELDAEGDDPDKLALRYHLKKK